MKALSLFANIGVAEAYLHGLGVDVAVANELVERRAKLYSRIYPQTKMICGNILDEQVFEEIIKECQKAEVEVLMATPPCQGMSTAGQQKDDDERNELIIPVINAVKRIKPNYVFIENVPMIFNTIILHNDKKLTIPSFIEKTLGEMYNINKYIIDTKDYSVPQYRERAIILLTKKGLANQWELPKKDDKVITMEEAIGHLPEVDPFVKDIPHEELLELFPKYISREKEALKISKWHFPPHHVKRQVEAMMHTPTGCTAFDNTVYYPKKQNGDAVKGYRNTYKRQNWNTPAYTVTMDNRKISSQNNVHPGRMYIEDGKTYYSDPRALTLYELMIISSIPSDWNIPKNTSPAFLRSIIGEGIPPLFVKKVFENLIGAERE